MSPGWRIQLKGQAVVNTLTNAGWFRLLLRQINRVGLTAAVTAESTAEKIACDTAYHRSNTAAGLVCRRILGDCLRVSRQGLILYRLAEIKVLNDFR